MARRTPLARSVVLTRTTRWGLRPVAARGAVRGCFNRGADGSGGSNDDCCAPTVFSADGRATAPVKSPRYFSRPRRDGCLGCGVNMVGGSFRRFQHMPSIVVRPYENCLSCHCLAAYKTVGCYVGSQFCRSYFICTMGRFAYVSSGKIAIATV